MRHSIDRNAAAVGLALLTADSAEEDIPLIQTIGLLSDHFGPLAAEALQRRRGGTEALQWLAERVAGWGRVYVVEALCRRGASSRTWLVRHAYLAVLERPDWRDTVRSDLDPTSEFFTWFTAHVATRLRLGAFSDAAESDER